MCHHFMHPFLYGSKHVYIIQQMHGQSLLSRDGKHKALFTLTEEDDLDDDDGDGDDYYFSTDSD